MATLADDCITRNDWVCPKYVQSRQGELLSALGEHVYIAVLSIVIGTVVAVPLALAVRRTRLGRAILLGTSTIIYTIPSVALFSLLLPFTHLSARTTIIGLVLYSLTIIVRAVLVGLDGVPRDVLDAAQGMGFGRARTLVRIELPLALPTLFAGLRVATVSTIALVTVGSLVGYGGLGNLISEGYSSVFKAQVLTSSLVCVVLALVADLLLIGAQRLLTPWRRTR